jgi:hypothetical protein
MTKTGSLNGPKAFVGIIEEEDDDKGGCIGCFELLKRAWHALPGIHRYVYD